MEELISSKISERGGAGIKLLLALLGLILIANAGYNFVPVAYQGENFETRNGRRGSEGNCFAGGRKTTGRHGKKTFV